MRALSVRQPYADQIVRGTKKIEYRSVRALVRGRVYIYASLTAATTAAESLPRGVIIGTVEIVSCTDEDDAYRWHIRRPRRLARHRRPTRKPQPVWFNPF